MAPPPVDHWDADKMFQFYLHDYMIKKGMHNAAKIFKDEAQVPSKPVYGFLHEWWSFFNDVFTSKQEKYQETGPGSSSKVPMLTDDARNDIHPRIPEVTMTGQRTPQEHLGYLPKDVEPSSHNLIKNRLMFFSKNSSNHLLQDVGKQTQKQVFKETRIGMHVERDIPKDPVDVMHKTMLSLDGYRETKINEALNPVPLNGWPINNQVHTSLLQSPNQDAVLAQAIACIPQNQTFIAAENSSKCTTLRTSETESSDKDKQMTNHMITTIEHQHSQDKQIQIQSQKIENYENAVDRKHTYENVESFLSLENKRVDHKVAPFCNLKRNSTTCNNENKGFSFEEVGCLHLSKNKVLSCHFSSNGKVLASAGHEKKVFIWNMETSKCVASTETHSLLITDVRFRPGSTIFATSSFDKSVRLWDATKPNRSQLKLIGHTGQVMSLDFHPRKVDLLCSCDSNDEIRLWNINECIGTHITEGGNNQVRFQSCLGKFLATSTGNSIKILDVETGHLLHNLEGHAKNVLSICWDKSGNYIASASEDSARVWSLDGKCISELHLNGNKFQSCIFHPRYLNLLIIGGYQSLELWSPIESSKTWSIPAHKGLIVGLADSPEGELVASASHDHCVKIWK